MFQTTSVPEFNHVFADDETQVLKLADRTGNRPQWLPVDETLNLATNTYARMKLDDKWCQPTTPGASAHVDGTLSCWNCSGPHAVNVCPEPRDEACIKRNRDAFRARRPNQPRNRDAQGRPLKYNKKQALVVDTKQLRKEQARAEKKKRHRKKKDKQPTTDDKSSESTGASAELKALLQTALDNQNQASSTSTSTPSDEQATLMQAAIELLLK